MTTTSKIITLSNAFSISKPPLLEFMPKQSLWRMWLSYNPDRSAGSYITFVPDPFLALDTIEPSGLMSSRALTRFDPDNLKTL
jgi:hypothetical protein